MTRTRSSGCSALTTGIKSPCVAKAPWQKTRAANATGLVAFMRAGGLRQAPRYRLGSALHVELAVDLANMVLQRQRADRELLADLSVALALAHPVHDLELASCQRFGA